MATTVRFTLSQLFKNKGGVVKTNFEGSWIRLEISIDGNKFVGRVGCGLEGLRSIEAYMEKRLDGLSYGLESTSSPQVGIDTSFYRRQFGNVPFEEKVTKFRGLVEEQKAQCDSFGFRVEEEIKKKGSFQDYFNGDSIDIIVVENEVSKKRIQRFLRDEPGEWKDFEFHLESEVLPESKGPKYTEIIDKWFDIPFPVDLSFEEKFDWAEEVEKEETQAEKTQVDHSNQAEVKLLIKRIREPITSLPQQERDKIFWGGGRKPESQRFSESITGKVFPSSEKLPLGVFIERVKQNLILVWGMEEMRSSLGDFDLGKLAVGLMLRSRGQLSLNFKDNTILYEPRSASYIKSQERLKGESK